MPEQKDELQKRMNQYTEEDIKRVKIGITTMDGVLQGKYIHLRKLKTASKSTGVFCDVVFGWDVNDRLYDDSTLFTGWHTGYPDAKIRIDFSTERRLRDENNIPFFIVDLVENDGKTMHPICPRCLLKRVLLKAKDMGFIVKLGFEFEFFVFDETPHTIREKNYQNLKSLTPGSFGYSVLRSSAISEHFNDFMDYFYGLGVEFDAVHCETGPAAWEASIVYDDALDSADKAIIFKTFSKVFFQKRNLMATFMAKWSMDCMASGCHVHQSLYDLKTRKPLFYEPEGYGNMSETMKQYAAGQLKYMRPFLVMSAPTINSYTRLVKGAWAPTCATWGVDNRTAALRVIPGTEKSQRIEHRTPGADGNPYLVAASIIAAGLLGIEQKLELEEETKGNIYEAQDNLPKDRLLPSNLRDSYRIFVASKEANDWFGEKFVKHYTSTRDWEVREYERYVTDWQMERYFEII